MADLSLLYGALQGMTSAMDIAKSLKSINDTVELNSTVINLQSTILDAQSKVMAAQAQHAELTETVRALKKEMADLKAWESEKQRYELKGLGGSFVYALKPDMQNGEAPHWICTNCYEKGKKSILQSNPDTSKGGLHSVCPSCNAKIDRIFR